MKLFHRHKWVYVAGYHGQQILTKAALTIVKARCSGCPRRRRFQYIGHWTAQELGWKTPAEPRTFIGSVSQDWQGEILTVGDDDCQARLMPTVQDEDDPGKEVLITFPIADGEFRERIRVGGTMRWIQFTAADGPIDLLEVE